VTAPASPAPLVALDAVSKRFPNGTQALAGMALDLRQGEFLTLLGPSGCGKSTVLRLVAGLAEPTQGRVLRPQPRQPGQIGFVFQDATLLPWRTVLGNVALPLRLAGVERTEARERARQSLAPLGLDAFARAYPRELSGGMKMRVAIARALVTRPRLLLMDEPFAALDEITRQRLNDEVLALWQAAGLTVLFVTHSVFEAAYLSSRVVVMTPRPGRAFADIALDQPPRRDEAYRLSEPYRARSAQLSAALHAAMAEGER